MVREEQERQQRLAEEAERLRIAEIERILREKLEKERQIRLEAERLAAIDNDPAMKIICAIEALTK